MGGEALSARLVNHFHFLSYQFSHKEFVLEAFCKEAGNNIIRELILHNFFIMIGMVNFATILTNGYFALLAIGMQNFDGMHGAVLFQGVLRHVLAPHVVDFDVISNGYLPVFTVLISEYLLDGVTFIASHYEGTV